MKRIHETAYWLLKGEEIIENLKSPQNISYLSKKIRLSEQKTTYYLDMLMKNGIVNGDFNVISSNPTTIDFLYSIDSKGLNEGLHKINTKLNEFVNLC